MTHRFVLQPQQSILTDIRTDELPAHYPSGCTLSPPVGAAALRAWHARMLAQEREISQRAARERAIRAQIEATTGEPADDATVREQAQAALERAGQLADRSPLYLSADGKRLRTTAPEPEPARERKR